MRQWLRSSYAAVVVKRRFENGGTAAAQPASEGYAAFYEQLVGLCFEYSISSLGSVLSTAIVAWALFLSTVIVAWARF